MTVDCVGHVRTATVHLFIPINFTARNVGSDKESKYNWAKFIVMAFVPLTGFYIIVVLFHINTNSPVMHGLVLFAQFISAPAHCRLL